MSGAMAFSAMAALEIAQIFQVFHASLQPFNRFSQCLDFLQYRGFIHRLLFYT